jgi:hypothetical protein
VFSVGALSTSSTLKPLQLWLSQAASSCNAAGSIAWVSSALGVTVFNRKEKERTETGKKFFILSRKRLKSIMADQALLRQQRDDLWGKAKVAMAALVAFQQQHQQQIAPVAAPIMVQGFIPPCPRDHLQDLQ